MYNGTVTLSTLSARYFSASLVSVTTPIDRRRLAALWQSELRDYEQIPLQEEGGIEAFIRREVLPYTPDAWLVEADTRIGYEVSFTRHFYQPPQLRTLAEISVDILALEQETEGLLHEITKGATA